MSPHAWHQNVGKKKKFILYYICESNLPIFLFHFQFYFLERSSSAWWGAQERTCKGMFKDNPILYKKKLFWSSVENFFIKFVCELIFAIQNLNEICFLLLFLNYWFFYEIASSTSTPYFITCEMPDSFFVYKCILPFYPSSTFVLYSYFFVW